MKILNSRGVWVRQGGGRGRDRDRLGASIGCILIDEKNKKSYQ